MIEGEVSAADVMPHDGDRFGFLQDEINPGTVEPSVAAPPGLIEAAARAGAQAEAAAAPSTPSGGYVSDNDPEGECEDETSEAAEHAGKKKCRRTVNKTN